MNKMQFAEIWDAIAALEAAAGVHELWMLKEKLKALEGSL